MSASRNRSSGWVRSALLLPLTVVLAVSTSALASGQPAGVSNEEWTSIQAQIEVERNKITKSDRPGRLYRADDPTQRFAAHFGADDVLITPRGGGEPDWQLGLRLTAWGDADDLQPVPPAGAIAEGNRVEYRRGPLTEWYVNTTMGLEQGFTIEAPPADGIEELVLEMALDGDLTPELSESGITVTFRHEDTNTAITYSGLAAWDAVAAPLVARIELTAGGKKLRLVIGVDGAAWPITIDPIFTQVAKLLPTPDLDDTEARFGQSVALDDELMVVGMNDVVFGDQSGAAHIFRRDEGGVGVWGRVIRLIAADGAENDRFGHSVAISGDTVVIGAFRDDDNGIDSGSAYVFERNQGGPDAWGQIAKITAADGVSDDLFGISVSISGDTACIGVRNDDDNGPYSGSAYVFERDQSGSNAWGQVAKLTASDGAHNDNFGTAVSISGDTVIVGAYNDDDNGLDSGTAYIFGRHQGGPGAWGQVTKLVPNDGAVGQNFGYSVSISVDTAIVGAHHDDDNGGRSGSAYLFQRDQGGTDDWGQTVKLTATDGGFQDVFGRSVSINGDTVVVGASGDEYERGSAYVFERDQGGTGTWGQTAKMTALDGADFDRFGASVAISGNTVVVGAWEDNGAFVNSGSAYVFQHDQGGPGAWGQAAYLPCPPVFSARGDHFGQSVAISDDTAIVGSFGDSDNGTESGAGYLFRRSQSESGSWEMTAKITASDGAAGDKFGASVAISGDIAVVGAYLDDDNGLSSGSAYIFQRNYGGPDAWGQIAKTTAPDGSTYDYFGKSVAVSGDTIVAGAYGDSSAHIYRLEREEPGSLAHVTKLEPYPYAWGFGNSVSMDGNTAILGAYADNGAVMDSGSAYVYQRDHGGPDAWGQVTKIYPSDGATHDWFGYSVSLSGDAVLIGAPEDDDDGSESGSGYVFRRNHGGTNAWGQVAKITADDGSTRAYFGRSVGFYGENAVVGANESVSTNLGSAYVFKAEPGGTANWTQIGRYPALGAVDNGIGVSVAINESSVFLGAWLDDGAGYQSGAVYVFSTSGSIFADDFESGDSSRWSVTVP